MLFAACMACSILPARRFLCTQAAQLRAFSPLCGRGAPHIIEEKTPSLSCRLSVRAVCVITFVRPLFGVYPVFVRSVSNASLLFPHFSDLGLQRRTSVERPAQFVPQRETTDRALVTSEKTPPRSTIPLCSTTGSLLPIRIGPGCLAVAERCNLLQIAVTPEKVSQFVANSCKAPQMRIR